MVLPDEERRKKGGKIMNLKDQLLSMPIDSKISLVNEINSYNGMLDFLVAWENEKEFFETFFEKKPFETVRAIYYGDYNLSDPYVRFDGYGNVESLTEYEFIDDFKNYIDEVVEALEDCKQHIDLDYYGIVVKENDEE